MILFYCGYLYVFNDAFKYLLERFVISVLLSIFVR